MWSPTFCKTFIIIYPQDPDYIHPMLQPSRYCLSNVCYYRNEKFIFKNTMIDNLSMSNSKSLLLSLSLITLLIMVLTSSSITLAETKNDLPRLIGRANNYYQESHQ